MAAIYRLLLLFYPRRFRQRFGRDMSLAFQSGIGVARANGLLAVLAYLFGNLADAFVNGMAERREIRRFYHRPSRGDSMSTMLVQDIRYGLRTLKRQPGFAVVVILTLAIGIGATTAIFSFVDGVLLRPLPYKEPGQLAFLWTKLDWIGVPRAWIAGTHVAVLRNQATAFEGFAAMRTTEMQLTGSGDPRQVRVGFATTNLIDVLGVQPMLGRGFRPEDGQEGNNDYAILSNALWHELGSDAGIIGRHIMIEGNSVSIVGVMPAGFRFHVHSSLGNPVEPDLWSPGTWKFEQMDGDAFAFALLGRVRSGVTLEQARAELDTIGSRLDREQYHNKGFGWQLVGIQEDMVRQARPALLTLAAGAVMVLLIVCANLSSLFLVRGAGREREFAIRLALGCSRRRIILQLLTESSLLALAGGFVGLVLAYVCVRSVAVASNIGIPRLYDVAVDARVLLFTAIVSISTGLIFGLVPGFRFFRSQAAEALKDGAKGSGGARSQRIRASLVVAEVALALVLLIGAGLLLQTFVALHRVDPGFSSSGVVTARLSLSASKYPDSSAAFPFLRELIGRLGGLPAVQSVGASTAIPLSRSTSQMGARPPEKADGQNTLVDTIQVTPGYFKAMGIPMRSGRDFEWTDQSGAEPVVVVDEIAAEQFWPGEDAIGKHLIVRTDEPWRVVGVVRQPRLYEVQRDDRPQIFLPIAQAPSRGVTLTVHTSDMATIASRIRSIVKEADPNQPIASLRLMEDVVSQSLGERRLTMLLIGAYAGFAVVLAALGIYGVIAYSVGQRTQEIGIRIALGATFRDVLRMIVSQGLRLTLVGIMLGLIGAFIFSRALSTQLYAISSTDPLTFIGVSLILVAVAFTATYLPARRATKIHPASALRSE